MGAYTFYTAGSSAALFPAVAQLQQAGYTFSDELVDHITHLLLPVPSLLPDGTIQGGSNLYQLLDKLPKDICIIGGNLPPLPQYTVIDLLQDPVYLAENAYITAHCAVRLMMENLPTSLRGCNILVIGWGRIGKCLATLLKRMEANVTIAARKENDRAILQALGYPSILPEEIDTGNFRVIFNTAPAPIPCHLRNDCLKIDLASVQGIFGTDVIHARGLPGKDAPEASGNLIARTILRLLKEDHL